MAVAMVYFSFPMIRQLIAMIAMPPPNIEPKTKMKSVCMGSVLGCFDKLQCCLNPRVAPLQKLFCLGGSVAPIVVFSGAVVVRGVEAEASELDVSLI